MSLLQHYDRDAIIDPPTCYYYTRCVRATGGDRCNTAARSLFFCLWFNSLLFFIHSQHNNIIIHHRRDGDEDDEPPPPDEDSRPPAAAAIARRTGIRCPLPLSTPAGDERSVDASSGLYHHTPPSIAVVFLGGFPDRTPT